LRAVQFVIQQTFSRTDAKQSEEKISLYLHIVHWTLEAELFRFTQQASSD